MPKNITKLMMMLFVVTMLVVVVFYKPIQHRSSEQNTEESVEKKDLIGGQKDDHGCLIGAGYSWCELKQKCLRTWEEPCDSKAVPDKSDWLTYTDAQNNFQINLPKTWEGYKATKNSGANYDSVSFSFTNNHQPFAIFQILVYSQEQWSKAPDAVKNLKRLSDRGEKVYVCDGCCGLDQNYNGGGQFDKFQQDRCKEGAEIVKTFHIIN